MAFGFNPRYEVEIGLANTSNLNFLVVALEAARSLEWNFNFISQSGIIASTKRSWKSYGEEITIRIDNGIAYIKSECLGNQWMDWGRNKKNVEAFLLTFDDKAATFTEEDLAKRLDEFKEDFASKENDLLAPDAGVLTENAGGFFSFFKPVEGYFITPIILGLNVIIFLTMIMSGVHILTPEGQELIAWGANFKPLTLEGQPWRLFTACFLHIGILHLALNMYALLYIGVLLEPLLGKSRFVTAYLVSGVAASVVSLWWNDLTISAGASGAIFGMYGVYVALLTTNLVEKSQRKALLSSILVFVGYNLLSGLKPGSSVDNAAHIGGLISGLIIGYAFVPGLKQGQARVKFLSIAVIVIALIIGSSFVFRILPNDFAKYEQRMERFEQLELQALGIYKLPSNTPDDEIVFQLRERGIYFWNEGLKVIDSCRKMRLPDPIQHRNEKLHQYCQLRIRAYELMSKGISEHTDKYQKEILDNEKNIEAIMTELSNN